VVRKPIKVLEGVVRPAPVPEPQGQSRAELTAARFREY
jgi:hypothetical protein